MTIQINGTSGISGVDGSAATPALQGSDTNTGISFGTDEVAINTGGTTAVTVDASQNVGIGTENPTGFIHIEGSSTGTETYGRFTTGSAAGDQSLVFKSSASRDHMAIQVSTNSGTADDLALQPDGGNVGVGISSPDEKLTLGAAGKIKLNRSDNATGATIHNGGGGQGLIFNELNSEGFKFQNNGTERLRLDDGGVLYIRESDGTPGAYHQMDGTGKYRVGNHSGGSGNYVYLSPGATSWSASSDERLKTNLLPIEDGLQKVSTLRAVTGRYLEDSENASRSFLIAQDVQAVLPEAVDSVNPDSLGLCYTDVIPLLVAALKESKDRVETLETQNAEQATTIASFEARISALEGGN